MGDEPIAVLDCLTRAWEERDVDGIEGLYAPDYEFVFGEGADATTWSRADEVETASKMFRNPQVQSIRLARDGAVSVEPGEDPDTWILRGVNFQLTIQAVGKDGSQEYNVRNAGHEFRVRRVAEPEPHWQIYRWIDPRAE